MIELISRESLLKKYDAEHEGAPGMARRLIEEEPTVEERKTGHWTKMSDVWGLGISFECSECGCSSLDATEYCPDCGSPMEGVEE